MLLTSVQIFSPNKVNLLSSSRDHQFLFTIKQKQCTMGSTSPIVLPENASEYLAYLNSAAGWSFTFPIVIKVPSEVQNIHVSQ